MKVRGQLLSFTKGWVAPEVEARFDLSAYQTGLREALNVRIRRTGGVSRRIGTRFVAEALSSPAKLVPFQFTDDQAYALEFGQATMRPLAYGGAVLEDGLSVTAITNAATASVTSAFHGYAVGDQVWFRDIEGMTEINDRFLTILTVPDANTFTVDFNSTNAGVFTGSGGGTVNVVAPPPPEPPPVVPPPIEEPTPPVIGGGGGGGFDGDGPGLGGDWAGNTGPHIP